MSVTREVHWTHDGAVLTGTLTLPAGRGPFPVIVLVHAAGQTTHHGWPYETHAKNLAQAGIAVLSYDKRGTGGSTGTYARFPSYEQLAGDALGGLERIRTFPEIDSTRIGLWGRSQGAWIIALAAARSTHVRFAIPVSGGAVVAMDQELFVQRNWLKKGGANAAQIAQADTVSRLVWTYYATLEGRAEAQGALDRIRATSWFAEQRQAISGYPTSGVLDAPDEVVAQQNGRFKWQTGLSFDPLPYWKQADIPILALFGGADEITPTQESERRMALLGSEHRAPVTVHTFPGASHSLCPAEPASGLVDGCATVPEYERTLIAWILAIR